MDRLVAPVVDPPRRRPRCAALSALGVLGVLAVVLAVVLAACSGGVPEVQQVRHYERLLERPLPRRVRPADGAVLARARQTNLTYGDDVRPRAAAPDHPLATVVGRVLAELPPPLARLAEAYLAAVYLVEGDVGTATTEAVLDDQGRWRLAYIVLNLTALERDANDWATWKEGSAFRPSPGYALRVTIEPEASDDRAAAVRFILLHELGHVLGLGLGVHGSWEDSAPLPAAAELSAFAALSWRVAGAARERRLVSAERERLPALRQIGFYRFAEAPHALSEAPAVYAALAQTGFPSLYGALQVYDDFAEAFAIYVHARMLGKPYEVAVLHDGQTVATYRSCVASGACAEKIAQVRALLDRAPSGPRIQVHIGAGAGVGRGGAAKG